MQPAAPEMPPGDASGLIGRSLGLPLPGLKSGDVQDTFNQARAAGERRHEATDIMAPRGTPVAAVDNGIIAKLFDSKQGGLTIYQFDSTEKFCFYYAHLDRYAEGLREGMLVKRGTTIGYVGSTGNADPAAPHLHFAIFELGPEKRWWEGKPINPYPILTRSFK
jgi:murein DD-endopeptidase MepM/ murein hydrolase activator NlpD